MKKTADIVMRTAVMALIAVMISSLALYVPVEVRAADNAKDISSCSIKLAYNRFIVDGNSHAPKVTVKYKGTKLRKYEDYVLTFENGIRAGRSAVIIRGVGSFRGTAVRYYTGETRKTSAGASKDAKASGSTEKTNNSGASKAGGSSNSSGASKGQVSENAPYGGAGTSKQTGAYGQSGSSGDSVSQKNPTDVNKTATGSASKKAAVSAETVRNIGSSSSGQKSARKEFDLGTVIKSPEYKACCGMIAEACIGEKGRKRGCVRGDQSGREVKRSKYVYRKGSHSRGWRFIVRVKDPEKADLIAAYSKQICSNDNIGYSQRPKGGRSSLYRSGKAKNYRFDRISQKVDTSCTPLALACMKAAGIKYINTSKDAGGLKREIRRVNRAYKSAGKKAPFSIITLNSSQYRKYKLNIKKGDVLCTGSHTAVAL